MKKGQTKEILSLAEKATSWIGSQESLIVHTVIFLFVFAFGVFDITSWNIILLVLTTAVSLEAIYLAIFIQMTINKHTKSLRDVEDDVEDIQEDIEELGEDVGEIKDDVEEIKDDVEDINSEFNNTVKDEKPEQTQEEIIKLIAKDVRRIMERIEKDRI